MEKKSFLIHKDSLHILDELTNEQAGQLFKAIRDVQNGIEYAGDPLIKIALVPFIHQFKRDNEKWEGIKERNSINGSKGGRPSKSVSNEETQENPKNPMGYLETQTNPNKPKKAVSVSVSVSDSVNGSDSDRESVLLKKETKKFIKPSIFEIENYYSEYTLSKNLKLKQALISQKANTFFDYYESNGWKVGKNPMKDWKATIRIWIAKDNTTPQLHTPPATTNESSPYNRMKVYQ